MEKLSKIQNSGVPIERDMGIAGHLAATNQESPYGLPTAHGATAGIDIGTG
jgi:hypothetical protein